MVLQQLDPTQYHMLYAMEKEYPPGSNLTIMNTYYQIVVLLNKLILIAMKDLQNAQQNLDIGKKIMM